MQKKSSHSATARTTSLCNFLDFTRPPLLREKSSKNWKSPPPAPRVRASMQQRPKNVNGSPTTPQFPDRCSSLHKCPPTRPAIPVLVPVSHLTCPFCPLSLRLWSSTQCHPASSLRLFQHLQHFSLSLLLYAYLHDDSPLLQVFYWCAQLLQVLPTDAAAAVAELESSSAVNFIRRINIINITSFSNAPLIPLSCMQRTTRVQHSVCLPRHPLCAA